MKKLLLVLLLSAFLLPGCGIKDNSSSWKTWTNQPGESISDPEQVEEDSAHLPADVKIEENESEEGQAEDGFSGETTTRQSLSERIAMEISSAEEREKEVEKKQEDAVTQPEMNETAGEMYRLWDDALNAVWKFLEEDLNKADMEVLRKEEIEWIAFKDAEVQAAGAENEGGSLQPLVEAVKAAELTKARVYELAKYAEGK